MSLAWFHCFSGIAGDMALGALVDAGADLDEVRNVCERISVPGWKLTAEPVLRGGIAATRIQVSVQESSVVRTAAHIQGLIEEAKLPPRVRDRTLATFGALAAVEGRLHRRPPGQVHFHEVGGLDAIIDVVGTCAALEVLDVDEVHASPVTTGLGMIRSAHGQLPNPAPAVVELLRGAPTRGIDVPVELTTPTGAALLAALCRSWGPMPAMQLEASGFGAGSRELDDRPNVTQVVLGEPLAAEMGSGQPVVLIETNVDDVTGEVLAHTVAELLAVGAHDAWVTPVVMKKGRPAHVVSALADVALASQVTATMAAQTGSLGVRAQRLERWPVARQIDTVEVGGWPVRVKISAGRVKAEHDDAVTAARAQGRPLRDVLADAERQWRAEAEPPPDDAG